MGILDTQNLNGAMLGNFDTLDNKRAPFGKKGQYNTGEDPGSNEYFGGFSYASDATTREAFGTDAADSRKGPTGKKVNQGNDFKYGTDGQARLSNSQTTLLGQAAKMTAGIDTEFGADGTAAQIAKLWTASDELYSLRNTTSGSGKEASGYDANQSYGISNWQLDVDAFTDDAAQAFVADGFDGFDAATAAMDAGEYDTTLIDGAVEIYRAQVTMMTGLRNINGIRGGFPMSRASEDVNTRLQEKIKELKEAESESSGGTKSGADYY